MPSATPLGTLATIPRELRDEIYRYLFPKRLVVISRYKASKSESMINHHGANSSHFAIIRTSRLLNEEATRVFYSETLFRYLFDHSFYYGNLPSQLSSGRMSNVEAIIPYGYQNRPQHLGLFFRGLCSPDGDTPLKNSIRVVFADPPRDMPRIGATGFFDHLEYLRSFRNTVIEVTWKTYFDREAGLLHKISDVDKKRLNNFLGVVLEQISKKVAKVLTPGHKYEMGPRKGLTYARRMVFHPRALPAKQNHRQDVLLLGAEELESCDV